MRIDWKPSRGRALRQAQGAALRPLGGLGALLAQGAAESSA